MTRQQKIEALEAIKNGTPIEYALMKKPCILNLHEDGFYFKNDGTIISKEDKEKYLNDAIDLENKKASNDGQNEEALPF